MNKPTDFDPAAIERLLKLGGAKFALDMIALFSSYGGQKIAEARQAQQAGDLPALATAAHPLKSSAGNVGAVRVQALATQIENSAGEQQAEQVNALVGELESAYAEAVKHLELEKAKLATMS